MGEGIIGLQEWLDTPPGRYLRAWESAQYDRAVADIFGFHALQLGSPGLDALACNRMPHRWQADDVVPSSSGDAVPGTVGAAAADPRRVAPARMALVSDFAALPFPAASIDLVVLAHALELNADPHATLREVERVLVPEGRVVICGLNPASLWGLRQRRARLYHRLGLGQLFLPDAGEFIGYWRLRDWLRLLSLELESAQFGAYRPAMSNAAWLARFAWMDWMGSRWWPILGAAYFIVAVKRVRGLTLFEPAWKTAPKLVSAPASVANSRGWSEPRAQHTSRRVRTGAGAQIEHD